jgi:hypothetical protein
VTEETRHRFLLSIAKQLPASRVAEVHLFPAMRQGGVESGVAVVALERELPVTIDVDGGYDQLADESAFVADETESEDAAPSAVPQEDAAPTPEKAPSRFTVFSACYRHTLKGPDRGKWEVAITEEADAPLITVDAVVRGVQRRSGEVDEIYRMSGDEFRASLPTADA